MDASQVADMFGVMAVTAITAVVTGALAALHPGARRWIRDQIDQYGRASAWLVAAVATTGSLWFSEGANFPPCELCWYQRIAMYPLVVVLGVRLFRTDTRGLRLAALGLVLAGLVVNAWHVTIETFPDLDTGSCDAAVPCTLRWVEGLGVFTIPRLATVAFVLVALTVALDRTDGRVPPTDDRRPS